MFACSPGEPPLTLPVTTTSVLTIMMGVSG